MGTSKGTRSFSFDVIAVTSRLSRMSNDSMACNYSPVRPDEQH